MNFEIILICVKLATLVLLLLSILYTIGVVWRVEMRLDTAYKFFLGSVIVFFLAEFVDMLYGGRERFVINLASSSLRMVSAAFFLNGMLMTRSVVRFLDGEKKKNEKPSMRESV